MKPIIYNPIQSNYKSPIGPFLENENGTFWIQITKAYHIRGLSLVFCRDDDKTVTYCPLALLKEEGDYNWYHTEKAFPVGLYWYYFQFEDVYGLHYVEADSMLSARLTDQPPHSWQLLVHHPFTHSCDWINGGIIYQIMVDRFYRSEVLAMKKHGFLHRDTNEDVLYQKNKIGFDFYGGNFAGIMEKLDYLAELGVSVIYLNPIAEAASNHKYDTGDYFSIDPMFGTELDFSLLCETAKQKNISIILDGVFNHTGEDSIYFNKYNRYSTIGAYQSKDSVYYDWYTFYHFPDEYRSWWGFENLPAVNQNHPDYVEMITGKNGVLSKYLQLGARGYRLDVVDELNEVFLDKIINRIREEKADAIVIGEVWEDASNKTAYGKRRNYFNGRQLDSVMNYPIRLAVVSFLQTQSVSLLKKTMREWVDHYPLTVLNHLMNSLSTHDTERLLTAFSTEYQNSWSKEQQSHFKMGERDRKQAIQKVKLAYAIVYMLPGIPCIYYGDEIGMEGTKDPFSRRYFAWEKMDTTILHWMKELARIRKEDAFKTGIYEEVASVDSVYHFKRKTSFEEIEIIVNLSPEPIEIEAGKAFDLLENTSAEEYKKIAPNQIGVLKKRLLQ